MVEQNSQCLKGPGFLSREGGAIEFSICQIRLGYYRMKKWSGQRDSNSRPSGPKPDALPDCAMPRTYM